MCIFVLCLIVVPLPPGKPPFAVQLNNNINFRKISDFASIPLRISRSSKKAFLILIVFNININMKVYAALSFNLNCWGKKRSKYNI
jgi:hypothetical protein